MVGDGVAHAGHDAGRHLRRRAGAQEVGRAAGADPRPAGADGRHRRQHPRRAGHRPEGRRRAARRSTARSTACTRTSRSSRASRRPSLEEHREAVEAATATLATVDDRAPRSTSTLDALRTRAARPRGARRALPRARVLLAAAPAAAGDGQGRWRAPTSRSRCPATAEAAQPRRSAAVAGGRAGGGGAAVYEPPTRVHHAHLVGVAIADRGAKSCSTWRSRGRPEALGDPAIELLPAACSRDRGPPEVSCTTSSSWRSSAWRHGLTLGGELLDTMIASFLVDPVKCIPHEPRPGRPRVRAEIDPRVTTLLKSGKSARLPERGRGRRRGHLRGPARRRRPRARAGAAEAPGRGGPGRPTTETSSARSPTCSRAWSWPASASTATTSRDGRGVPRAQGRDRGADLRARRARVQHRLDQAIGRRAVRGAQAAGHQEERRPAIRPTPRCSSGSRPSTRSPARSWPSASCAKLINTYTDVLRDAIAPETGRIHASFQQTVGVSGRLISTDPDLQRTPVRTPEGQRIPAGPSSLPEGPRIISADWSQIELRVLAHFSKDPRLVEAFRDKLDLHRRTAALLFRVAPEAGHQGAAQRRQDRQLRHDLRPGRHGAGADPRHRPQGRAELHRAVLRSTTPASARWLDRTIAEAHEKRLRAPPCSAGAATSPS